MVACGLQIQRSMGLFSLQEQQTAPSLYGYGTTMNQKSIALQPDWRYIIKLLSSDTSNNLSLGLMAMRGLSHRSC